MRREMRSAAPPQTVGSDMEFAFDDQKSAANTGKSYVSETNRENLEKRFDNGDPVLDYFDTDIVLTDETGRIVGVLRRHHLETVA